MGINDANAGLVFERAAAAHFGLPFHKVLRGMVLSTGASISATLTVSIEITADDLGSISAYMKDGNEAGTASKLREFLGKSVQSQMPAPAQAEPATTTVFQVGDKVMLKSGGPVMTVSHVRGDEKLTCTWHTTSGAAFKDFLPHCLVIAAKVQFNPVRW